MPEIQPIIIKKKKVVAGGHHGGSWKVAYADFVTAMMAFFMVMWIMGMDQSTRSMIAGYFNDPFGMIKSPPKSQSAFSTPGEPKPKSGIKPSQGTAEGGSAEAMKAEQESLENLKARIENEIAQNPSLQELAKNMSVTVTDEGLKMEFSETVGAVFFESGAASIRPQARELVAKVAPYIAKSGHRVVLEGHTDAKPYAGSGYTNWDLSTDRALSLRRALSSGGVKESQFLSVNGYADTRLKNDADPYHFSNRRVTLLLPFRKPVEVSENLAKDVFKEVSQGAFKSDVMIAPKH